KNNASYILVVPGMTLLVFFLIIPLIASIFPTFLPQNGGISNYLTFFSDSYNRSIFWRTLRVSLIVTVISLFLGVPTAYFISGLNKKMQGILMALTLFPLLTNSVIRSFAWINILGKNGVINQLLLTIGLISQPLDLLYTEFVIFIGSVFFFFLTMILTLVGVMEGIEEEMLEAAATLGASSFTTFMRIVLPLSLPGAIVGSILVFTGTLTAYTTPQLLGGNQKMLLSTFLYQKANTIGDWNAAGI